METRIPDLDYDVIWRLARKARVERDAATADWIGHLMTAAVRAATRVGKPSFRRARSIDIPTIVALVNTANSGAGGTGGWTHELGLFHGSRTDAPEIRELFAAPNAMFVLWLDGDDIGGCAYLKRTSSAAYLGLLSVWPSLQARGIGSRLIAECERIARDEWGIAKLRISVITSHRPEITAYYQRRGFALTGQAKTFERRQRPRVGGLRLEWMEKSLLTKGFSSWLHRARVTPGAASAAPSSSR